MTKTPRPDRAAFVAPHHLAAKAGQDVLAEGGAAIEAMIAAAAAIAVVYPHMNGLGGDAFWLLASPGEAPVTLHAVGRAGAGVTSALYGEATKIEPRGVLAANTAAATVAGWGAAKARAEAQGGRMGWPRLLRDAISYASDGFETSRSQAAYTARVADSLRHQPGFADRFLPGGDAQKEGERQSDPRLAAVLKRLADAGPDDFYRGDVAAMLARDFTAVGMPLTGADLAGQGVDARPPISLTVRGAEVFNLCAPTQGITSLTALGLYDRVRDEATSEIHAQHLMIEACKRALDDRERVLGDPDLMEEGPETLLASDRLDLVAADLSRNTATPWPRESGPGDTIYMACLDREGRSVSFIQSIYWEFGAGIVLPESGLTWQNRGCSFSLSGGGPRRLEPGRRPFHTLNPGFARLDDGSELVYGTMGGDGQPQTLLQIFDRMVWRGMHPGPAIAAPRWVVGKTWGRASDDQPVTLETFDGEAVLRDLESRGHDMRALSEPSELLGHAGAIRLYKDGTVEASADPRSDGCALFV